MNQIYQLNTIFHSRFKGYYILALTLSMQTLTNPSKSIDCKCLQIHLSLRYVQYTEDEKLDQFSYVYMVTL